MFCWYNCLDVLKKGKEKEKKKKKIFWEKDDLEKPKGVQGSDPAAFTLKMSTF